MDESAVEIQFTATGCNFCDSVVVQKAKRPTPTQRQAQLERQLRAIRIAGKGKEYDCIVGVSGGVDSTYTAYWARKNGLRPLAVHFDNGWDSELAVANIEKTLKTLNIELSTFVMDWAEFRRLQIAFLRASVPDGEVPTDHGIFGALFDAAQKHQVRYLVSGANFATEAILPGSWTFGTGDWRYIKDVFRKHGTGDLRSFPHVSFLRWQWVTKGLGIRFVYPLDLIDYSKSEAMRVLENELSWKYYGGKHYESVYTRFFQAYILPTKFGIDKRKAHLSTLIANGEISRDFAINELDKPICPEGMIREDTVYVLKKLGLSEKEFAEIMAMPPRSYREFNNGEFLIRILRNLRNAKR
jgi:N-acetyl sugar amidotransferase